MSHSLRPVVCAPRRLCAPSSLLLHSLSVMAGLLLAAPNACAQSSSTYPGSYVWTNTDASGNVTESPTFTGGQWYSGYKQPAGPCDYDGGSNGSTGGGTETGDSSMQIKSTGTVNAAFIWSDTSNSADPAPPAVLMQTSIAYWYGNNPFLDTPLCSDGLGDPEMDSLSGSTLQGRSSGTLYTLGTPSGGTISLSLTGAQAKVNPGDKSGGNYGSLVQWDVTISPVTIEPTGATSDGQGGWDILVGQDFAPFLAGIPSNCTVSNYQWTVTGTTMQSWTVSSDSTRTAEVDGSGKLNIASPGWFWNDASQTSETITCTATVTPPAGEGDPFPVTASQTIGVYLPSWTASGNGGEMSVDKNEPNNTNPDGTITNYWLHAGPISGSGQVGGMEWIATLAPPSPCPVTFEKGNIYLVQTITPSAGYINTANQQYENADEGQLGIDTQWPYAGGWAASEDDDDPISPNYTSNDSPGINLTYLSAIYGSEMSSFEDYIMFQPYGSSGYVPLGYFKWSINGTATIPSTNNWGNFRNPAGPIDPSGSPVPFTPSNAYPSWTQNSGNGIGFKPF